MFTDKQREMFIDGISKGLDTEAAASFARISAWTVYNILEKGKREQERISKNGKNLKPKTSETDNLKLYMDFMEAKSNLQLELLGSIRVSDNFKAQQYLLEKVNKNYNGSDGLQYFEEDPNGY